MKPIERAQILLELLHQQAPTDYADALAAMRKVTQQASLLETPGGKSIIPDLPGSPQDLLYELHCHLHAMAGNDSRVINDELYSIHKLLGLLPCQPEPPPSDGRPPNPWKGPPGGRPR